MKFNVNEICPDYDFYIEGVSYMGAPRPNTAMYISKKVEDLLHHLSDVKECLVFAEDTIEIPSDLARHNCFVLTSNPQGDYARFVNRLSEELEKEEAARAYNLTPGGYFVGENVCIGENAYIEPGALIGHDVVIGNHARILSGAVIKHAVIGKDILVNEKAVIGANGFTMTHHDDGELIRIPSLGKVRIGDNVEIGVSDSISRGSAGDTILEDHVKVSALVNIAHDVHICRNAQITAGVTLGGYCVVGEGAFIGLNAVLRNRITIGKNCFIGMGTVVATAVKDDDSVIGQNSRHVAGPISRYQFKK